MPTRKDSTHLRIATGRLVRLGRRAAAIGSAPDLRRPFSRSELESFERLQHGAVTAVLRQDVATTAQSPDPQAHLDSLTELWHHLDRPGMEHDRREVAEQCLLAAERAPGGRFEIESWDRLFSACLAEGDLRAALRAHSIGLRRADEAGLPEFRHLGARRAATLLTAQGRFDLARAEVLKALRLGTSAGDPLAQEIGDAQLAWLDVCRGQPAVLGERSRLRPDERGFDTVPEDGRWADVMVWATFRVVGLQRGDLAALLYDVLARYPSGAATYGAIATYGSTASLLAELASMMERWDLAAEHFEEGFRLDQRMGHIPAAVRSRRAFGEMLLRRGAAGDRARALPILRDAFQRSAEIGMWGVAADCERLLEMSRRAPRGSAEHEGA